MSLQYYRKILEESEFAIVSATPEKQMSKVKVTLKNGIITSVPIYSLSVSSFLKDYNYTELAKYKEISGKGSSALIKSIVNSYVESKQETPQVDMSIQNTVNLLNGAHFYADSVTGRTLVIKDEQLLPYSGEAFMSIKGIDKKDLYLNAVACRMVYAPRVPSRFFNANYPGYKDNILHVNTFNNPPWMEIEKPEGQVPRPTEFCELIEHLIPLEEDRDFFIHWFYRSLIARARTFLVMCGEPGVGKTTVRDVFKAVHGPDNTVDGKKSTLTGQFNAQLSFGTLMWFDELKYTEENENFMKEMPNDTMAIEFKGVDTTMSTELHNSYVISNNKPRDNYIAMDSRKFAPIGITKTRLDKIWAPDKIDNFRAKLNPRDSRYDIKFVANIGYWIIQEGPKHEGKYLNDEYSSRRLQEIRHTSLSKWKRRLVSMLEKMDESGMSYKEVPKITSEVFSRFKIASVNYDFIEEWFEKYNTKGKSKLILPDETTVMAFLKSYVNLDGQSICTVEHSSGEEIVYKIGKSSVPFYDILDDGEGINPIDAL